MIGVRRIHIRDRLGPIADIELADCQCHWHDPLVGDNNDEQAAAPAKADEATAVSQVVNKAHEGEPVEIHKPKPIHGWRDLAKEIGVIVIGVLIALAGEQAVEAIHWRLQAGEAQHAVGREIANDVSNYAERIVIAPCLEAQLDQIESRVTSSVKIVTPMQVERTSSNLRFVYRFPTRTWSTQVWAGVVSEGVASHLPDDLRIGLGEYYGVLERMHGMADAEADAGAALLVLSKPISIDAGSRFQLIQVIEAERARVSGLAVNAETQLKAVKRFAPTALDAEGRRLWYSYTDQNSTAAWCRAHHLPLNLVPAALVER